MINSFPCNLNVVNSPLMFRFKFSCAFQDRTRICCLIWVGWIFLSLDQWVCVWGPFDCCLQEVKFTQQLVKFEFTDFMDDAKEVIQIPHTTLIALSNLFDLVSSTYPLATTGPPVPSFDSPSAFDLLCAQSFISSPIPLSYSCRKPARAKAV